MGIEIEWTIDWNRFSLFFNFKDLFCKDLEIIAKLAIYETRIETSH